MGAVRQRREALSSVSGSRSGAAGDSRLSYFSPPYPTVSQKTDARRQSAVWLPVGLSFGCGIGIALRSLSLGVGIGLVFGVTMMIITRRRPERSAVRSLVSRYDPIPRKEEARCPASHAVVARARRLLRLRSARESVRHIWPPGRMKKRANKPPLPTPANVTPAAGAPVAPPPCAAGR
jgi:hypothetical protein